MAKRRFRDSADIRRYISSLINRVETGELDSIKAKTLIYAVQQLWRVITESTLEGRVTALEKLLGDTNELKKTN